jgi:hypothetical protein
MEIKQANSARRKLTRQAKADTGSTRGKKIYRLIKDERLVREPTTSYIYFNKARSDSGDLDGLPLTERAKLVAQEWKKLSASERKVRRIEAHLDNF